MHSESNNHVNTEGMSWIVTALFIVGETAGAGLIALPTALLNTGAIPGTILIITSALICTYTGIILGHNWTTLLDLFPEYRDHCRKPYPVMGFRAVGPRFAHLVSALLQLTQFGTAVVFILLAAKNGENMLHANFGTHVSFCYMILIVGVLVFPFTLPRSPKDFWYAVVAAMISTSISIALIVVGAIGDADTCKKDVFYPPIDVSKSLMSFGTIMFAYGGHCAFPTIQHDMRKPQQFGRSVSLAFLIDTLFYLPVSLIGYLIYGSSLTDSIIPSIQNIPIQTALNVLMTLHVILALTIIFNPINQEVEEVLNISHDFGWKRVISRAFVMISVLFVAESIPNFGVLLDLVGGSTITLMSLVLPIIFNISLTTLKKRNGPSKKSLTVKEIYENSNKPVLFLNCLIMVFGIAAGIVATTSAMQTMMNSEFSAPCYAKLWSEHARLMDAKRTDAFQHGKLACCGVFRNISVFGPDVCLNSGAHQFSIAHG